jgi:hypothetical protein
MGGGNGGATTGQFDEVAAGAMGAENEGEEAGFGVGGLKYDCTGAVAEQDTGGAIIPVHEAREDFGCDNEDCFVSARLDKLATDGDAVNEAGAGRFEVEGACVVCTYFVLDDASCGGEEKVGRGSAADDEVDLGRRNVSTCNGLAGGGDGKGSGSFVVACDVALSDAGASGDPLVSRVYEFFEVKVGEHLLRYPAPPAGNSRVRCQSVGSPSAWPIVDPGSIKDK